VKITLILFAKLPIFGEVKTRIGQVAGDEYAFQLYSTLLDRTLRSAIAARRELLAQGIDAELLWCFSGDWQSCLAAPDRVPSALVLEFYQSPANAFAQIDSADLGARMHAALFARSGARLLFGSDIPGLSAERIVTAAKRLHVSEAETWLVNPTLDGGYCLIGTNTSQSSAHGVFMNMVWSTESVMAMTRKRLSLSTSRLIELAPLADVDSYPDAEKFLSANSLT
jgi:uncharacterized protein